MDLRSFLGRVLPSEEGAFFGATPSDRGGFVQRKFETQEALAKYIEAMGAARRDVYFGVAAFRQRRQIEDVVGKRALYADIDSGPDKPHATQKEAARALLEWCDANFVRPSVLINSGRGFHAYWTLNRTITRDVWQRLADALRQHMEDTGFPVLSKDASIITDAARVLRPPGTVNFKYAVPYPVKLVYALEPDYDPDALGQLLSVSAAAMVLPAEDNDDLSSGVDTPREPKPAQKLFEQCEVFKEMLATGGAGVPGLSWMQQLHVLAYTSDGETYVHEISKGHEEYSRHETELKWAQRVRRAKDVGPTTCNTFSKYHPELCARCPNNGRVKSPLVLTFARTPADLPWPYEQDDKGVYFMQDEGETKVRIPVVPFKVLDFVLYQAAEQSLVQFTADFGTHSSTAILEYPELIEKRSAIAGLSSYHILIADRQFAHFRDFIMSWALKMQQAKAAKPVIAHLGWVEHGGRVGFGVGDKVHWSDGTSSANATRAKNLMSMYTPVGARSTWVDVASKITNSGRHAVDAIVLSAFASPLMLWTPTAGSILAFVSRESGSGKSTALKCAQAVWGDPVRGINALDDTPASILFKIGYTKNLPAYWDEVRARQQAASFVRMIYSLSQGKERSRLKATITLQDAGTWSTMLTVASNESIADHAESVVQDSESGRVRIFEVRVPVIPGGGDQNLYRQVNELQNNYGVIGDEYAQFLSANREKLKTRVGDAVERIGAALKATQTDRFWLSTVAALYVACELTSELGLLSIDKRTFLRWLVDQLKEQRAAAAAQYATIAVRTGDLLAAYANQYRDQLLVCDHLTGQGRRTVGAVHVQPVRGAVVGMIALKDKAIRLQLDLFKTWLYNERSESPSQIISQFVSDGAQEVRAKLGGTATSLDIRVRCLDVPLKDEDLDSISSDVGVFSGDE